ncbi:g-type lectin s-receptor-like serine/threonine-protein kinase b120 [Phtheirospermum japonicum]|uniref:Receptor-like serine/threonine-protein kinase n=1 Tax=Phtheirospermum japonicum TaxID=374723 RepID=A0A830BJ49_9LAMI|nr:g-type lectin s-receptor-like serine/threonine-protein kinase b120 [Phtheirospermum japonicum]
MDFNSRYCTIYLFIWCFFITAYRFSIFSFAADRFSSGHSIRDGETLISARGKFALGFFSPNSSSRYVGIWYNRVGNQSVVWVANRERPISGNDAVLTIGNDSNLIITQNSGQIIWSTNSTLSSANSTAILLETGNLILHDTRNSDRILWRSFDHPTDTYLPDMEVRINVRDGEKRVLSSWRSPTDPSPGNYSMGVDPRGPPQIVIWEGPNRRWRSGHWNGLIFTGVPEMRAFYRFGFRLNERNGLLEVSYTPSTNSDLVQFRLNTEGIEVQERWIDERREWNAIYRHPVEECDNYNYCGNFGKCQRVGAMRCGCVEGFEATDNDRGGGCRRRAKLQCETGNGKLDGFLQVENVKLPDFVDYVGPEDGRGCERICRNNCSCTAYAFVSGINCMIWHRELVDVQQFEEGGNNLFVRVAHSELSDKKNHVKKAIIITTVIVGSILIFVSIWILLKCKRNCHGTLNRNEMPKIRPSGELSSDLSGPCDLVVEGHQSNGTELAMFNFNSLVTATDNFSDENKLGGQEIAVKRLSRKSGQGLEEFKNEIMLIAKLQHRNLVRLLGCCIHGEEKLLLYEYMPNNSLESYIFDLDKRAQLDWSKRFSIIGGIARGLVYLHRDSRLRIIHRDLKASNILLDEEMNPKISDFGMARIFGGNQDEANTNRVVGTYGYMAPEYAMEGLFSLKSDVYSFGVLLLEIITGRRNNGFRLSEYSNIIGYAWDLWDRGTAIELLDPSISKSGTFSLEQVLRCIHVAVLCVQDIAAHRPDMPAVVLMLEGENTNLPLPRQPTFTSMRHNLDPDTWNVIQDDGSSNNVTISVILGR